MQVVKQLQFASLSLRRSRRRHDPFSLPRNNLHDVAFLLEDLFRISHHFSVTTGSYRSFQLFFGCVASRHDRPASVRQRCSYEETRHLLRSPANADRLLHSIAELEKGGGAEKTLDE